jgi:centromeric protein E
VPPKSKQRETTKHRSGEGTGRKLKPKGSMQSLRPKASNSNLVGSPSLLNGTGESNLISSGSGGARVSDSLLSIPSPSASRSSSADGSYQTDVTAFEDMGEDHGERGRAKKAHNSVAKRDSGGKDSKGNVLVSVRVRPDASNDESRPEGEWLVDGRRALISYKGREAGDYRYDNVFSPNDSNHRVYDNAAKRLVRRVMEGYHGTVFAYGMTGTGKTFSMQGTANSPGVIPLAITDIFSYIREMPSREFLLRVSYLEIYNEKIYDLLSPAAPGQQQEDIKLREDSKRGVYASPLKEEIVQSPNQLLRVIARGDLARRTGSTQFNARSSRSHAVVQIVVESRERGAAQSEGRRGAQIAPGGVLVSTLSLIDLAGSEKAAESKERRTEGAHINKSLLTLGTVIARLSTEEEGAKDKDKAVKHLPYRDSKLTRLLQGALSGDSLVSILCTIQLSSANTSAALAISHTAETLNTLKFASRAKNNIVSHAKRNESNATPGDPSSRALLDRYKMEIEELRAQLQQQTKDKEIAERREEIEKDRIVEEQLEREEKTRHEEQMLEMQLARTALKERISHLNRLILSSKSIGVNSGRYSSASGMLNQRASAFSAAAQSEYGRPVSIRSRDSVRDSKRDSTVTLEVPMPAERTARAMSSGSIIAGTLPTPQVSHLVMEETSALAGDDDCEDTTGEDGEGNASLAQQNRMLQADLADKNRYIATLEKRLLQARRTSHSRVSMHFAARVGVPEEGSLEALLRDREREVEELRAKLDDQMRMVTALRSAARKREMVDQRTSHQTMGSEETARPATSSGATDIVTDLSSLPFNRTTSSRLSRHSSRSTTATDHNRDTSSTSRSSTGVVNFSKNPLSPVALLSPSHSSNNSRDNIAAGVRHQARIGRRKSVDEMTQLLDEMIQNKIQSGHVVRGDRGSLRVRSDKIQQSITSGVDGCLPEE